MKLRIAITVLITTCFAVMYFTRYSTAYLLIGDWSMGVTDLSWGLYIFLSIISCFVSCFYPKSRSVLLVVIAPLMATLICKSLAVIFILIFQKLSIQSFFIALSGLLLAYLFLVLYWQLGAKFNQAILLAATITVGLCPISYEFTQKMIEQPLTSQGSNATTWQDALTRASA